MLRLRWRDYRTRAGARPVNDFIESLTDEEAACVVAAMKEIATEGLALARHVRDEVYEVRAFGPTRSFRILFAKEAKFVLLSLSAFVKKTARTPASELQLAVDRLKDWRLRGRRGSS